MREISSVGISLVRPSEQRVQREQRVCFSQASSTLRRGREKGTKILGNDHYHHHHHHHHHHCKPIYIIIIIIIIVVVVVITTVWNKNMLPEKRWSICQIRWDTIVIFISVRSSQGKLSNFEITRASALFSRKFQMQFISVLRK